MRPLASCPLFADLLATRLRQDDLWQHEPAWQHYFGLNGTPDLLDVTANFLQERLAQVMIISAGDCARLRSLWSGAKANCREIADGEWGERWAWGSGLDHIGPWGCRHRTHPHICKVALFFTGRSSSFSGFLQIWMKGCRPRWWGCTLKRALCSPHNFWNLRFWGREGRVAMWRDFSSATPTTLWEWSTQDN